MQLNDAVVPLVRAEARRLAASEHGDGGACASPADARADGLHAAARLLDRLDRRDLYRFAGSVVMEDARDTPPQQQVIEELSRLGAGALPVELLRLDTRRLHYGRGARNPVDALRFFDNKDAPEDAPPEPADDAAPRLRRARRQPAATYSARLPGAFEEVSLRVFVTDAAALPAARAAFARWCEARALCNDACQLEELDFEETEQGGPERQGRVSLGPVTSV